MSVRAGRQFEALKERQFQAEQKNRIERAREMKDFRQGHLDLRQSEARQQGAARERKIEARVQELQQTAERNLRQEPQRQRQAEGWTLRQEMQRQQPQDQQQTRTRSM